MVTLQVELILNSPLDRPFGSGYPIQSIKQPASSSCTSTLIAMCSDQSSLRHYDIQNQQNRMILKLKSISVVQLHY